ncbi:MAG TPA: response regulator transcription factor [Rariglobus sp.]|jgi:two-component system response regulator DevR|nr:response regulator transcription factor [Rariglobus sp.]
MTTPINLLLVDDSELVRRGIKSVLQSHAAPKLNVVGEAGNVVDAVTECLRLKPGIVLLDIRLPDGSGFDACRQIMRHLPSTRIIVLTSYSNDNFVYEAATSGAQGYLMKEIDPAGLIQGVIDVSEGRSILDFEATSRVLRLLREGNNSQEAISSLASLSPQENRVLALVAEGKTNKEIGEQLTLSENTVKNYLVNVFDKLKIKRRSQAAALFVQQAEISKKSEPAHFNS